MNQTNPTQEKKSLIDSKKLRKLEKDQDFISFRKATEEETSDLYHRPEFVRARDKRIWSTITMGVLMFIGILVLSFLENELFSIFGCVLIGLSLLCNIIETEGDYKRTIAYFYLLQKEEKAANNTEA